MGFSCQALNSRADQKLYHLQVGLNIVPSFQVLGESLFSMFSFSRSVCISWGFFFSKLILELQRLTSLFIFDF